MDWDRYTLVHVLMVKKGLASYVIQHVRMTTMVMDPFAGKIALLARLIIVAFYAQRAYYHVLKKNYRLQSRFWKWALLL